MAVASLLTGCGSKRDAPPASPRVVSIVQDDAELLHRSDTQVAVDLDTLAALGTDWVRVTAGWSVIAPSPAAARPPAGFDARDPDAYPDGAWNALDRVDDLARTRGLRLAIDIAFWAPRWAVAHPRGAANERDGVDPARFADFAEAVARRYPDAVAFTVWNEPNHNAFLLPQWQRAASGWRPAAPHEYRAMLEAAVPRIRAAAPRALVLIGGLSSVGTSKPEAADDRMAPLAFLRAFACVDEQLQPLDVPECRGFKPLPGDGFSFHPYSQDRPPWEGDPRPDTVRLADLDRLTQLLARLHAAGRTETDLPVYLTEFGYQTNPPDPTWDVTLADQARWLPEAEEIARADPAVRSTAQFLLRDLPERPGPDLRTRWRDYQSGLQLEDGTPKPAQAAYALGLTARRTQDGRVAFWGLDRAGSGPRDVALQVREAGGWRTLATLRSDEAGVVSAELDADATATFRLRAGDRTSPGLAGAR